MGRVESGAELGVGVETMTMTIYSTAQGGAGAGSEVYWLELFPKLNTVIPKEAHPDLPKFNPPFDEAATKTYQDKNPSKVPRASPKLQDKINETFSKLAEASIINKHANPVGVASYVVLVTKPDGSLRICINFCKVNKMIYTCAG